MNSKYKVLKFNSNKFENFEDLVSIEEPLEISLKFKEILSKTEKNSLENHLSRKSPTRHPRFASAG